MKKIIATLITLTMLLLVLPAFAGGDSVTLTFESKTYNIEFESAEVVDGVLNVSASGFGKSIPIRNGEFLIPFWVYAVSGGETYGSTSVSCGGGTYTFHVECDCVPEEIYIYEYDDKDHAVLLWQNSGATDAAQDASTDTDAPAFCGEWRLVTIAFLTPNMDNGIFEAEMTLSVVTEEYAYGSDLALNADGTMTSDIDVYSLIEAISQFPFSVPDLRLNDYTKWIYEEDLLSIVSDNAILTLVYNEEASQLTLTYSDIVEIRSETNKLGYISKGGMVEMQITLELLRPEAVETT